MIELGRRDALLVGLGATLLITGCAKTPPVAPISFTSWQQQRRAPYFIAHRGAGITIPEHSLPGYRQALKWGAEAMELSVVISSDGVLYCHHDLTLDRTTTLTGRTSETTAAVLDTGRIKLDRLGPAWAGAQMPAIPRLDAVLDEVGNRVVICVEAKDDRAYEPMMALLTERGLLSTTVAKISFPSSRIEQAKQAGLPVFAYLGNLEVATLENVALLSTRLNPATDALALPVRVASTDLDESVIRAAVATGLQVWMFPVYRRSDVARLSALGATGMITPSLGYLNGREPLRYRDHFADRQLTPGLTTRDPYSDWDAVGWGTADAIELIESGERYVCLGDLGPIATARYQVELEFALIDQPMADADAFGLAFGCPDDRYFGSGEGYLATLRGDGAGAILSRSADGSLVELAEAVPSGRLQPNKWRRLSVGVDPERIGYAVDGQAPIQVADRGWRGGYLHIGRTAGGARIAVRGVSVRSS